MKMKRRLGKALMAAGAALVIAALALFLFNQWEARRAADSVREILPQIIASVEDADFVPDPYDPDMREVEIDGYSYIGYLSLPTLGLELPVMAQWDYDRLQISPCRYAGSSKTDDLVIAAHNYAAHFGRLSELSPGDVVRFTDMDGVVSRCEVISVEILAPMEVGEMTDSGYDLTLFTCTYGGQSRVTVRCQKVEAS